jgi:hypothetical protein
MILIIHVDEFDDSTVIALGVQSQKLSNVRKGGMGDQKYWPGAVVSSNKSALSPRGGLWPVLLICNS